MVQGEKEKNLVDVHNFRLNLPSLQYQNRTWTWLDLMMAVKKDYKQVLVGQVKCKLEKFFFTLVIVFAEYVTYRPWFESLFSWTYF